MEADVKLATEPVMPPKGKASGVRARVRAELTAEILTTARSHLAAGGAPGLSLRAIARELGMASSAIYRYFSSRDELLTALIVDAYNALGDRLDEADASVADRADRRGRFVAIGRALRAWAIANPHEYALIYGSPVPGYTAPSDTIDPATRVSRALLALLVDAAPSATTGVAGQDDPGLEGALAQLIEYTRGQVPAQRLAPAIEVWGELFGLVSLELFGHFTNAVTEPAAFFEHALSSMASRILP